jgi:hypothetical protein
VESNNGSTGFREMVPVVGWHRPSWVLPFCLGVACATAIGEAVLLALGLHAGTFNAAHPATFGLLRVHAIELVGPGGEVGGRLGVDSKGTSQLTLQTPGHGPMAVLSVSRSSGDVALITRSATGNGTLQRTSSNGTSLLLMNMAGSSIYLSANKTKGSLDVNNPSEASSPGEIRVNGLQLKLTRPQSGTSVAQ